MFEETKAKTLFLYQNYIITNLKNQLFKKVVRGRERYSEIKVIFNKYKDILNNFTYKSDLKILPKIINKKSCNAPKFKSNLVNFLKKKF